MQTSWLMVPTLGVVFLAAFGGAALAGLDGDGGDAYERRTGYRSPAAAHAAELREKRAHAREIASLSQPTQTVQLPTGNPALSYNDRRELSSAVGKAVLTFFNAAALSGNVDKRLKELGQSIILQLPYSGGKGFLIAINAYKTSEGAFMLSDDLVQPLAVGESPSIALANYLMESQLRPGPPRYVLPDQQNSGYLWIARDKHGDFSVSQYIGFQAAHLKAEGFDQLGVLYRQKGAALKSQIRADLHPGVSASSKYSGSGVDHAADGYTDRSGARAAPVTSPSAGSGSRMDLSGAGMTVQMRDR